MDPVFVEEELRRAEEIDPENARYNLLLAMLLTDRSVAGSRPGRGPRIEITDRALLDEAMSHLLKVQAKPYYRSYTTDMLKKRLGVLPPARRIEDRAHEWGLVATTPALSLISLHRLGAATATYAKLLISEDRRDEAELSLQLWYPVGVKLFRDISGTSDFVLVSAYVRKAAENSALVYGNKADSMMPKKSASGHSSSSSLTRGGASHVLLALIVRSRRDLCGSMAAR